MSKNNRTQKQIIEDLEKFVKDWTKEMTKVIGTIQGIIEEKMFYADQDKEKITPPQRIEKPAPGKPPTTKKDIPYTRNVKQFKELQGMEPDIYNMIVAGRFGGEIRVKPYDDQTKKHFVSTDQFKWLAQTLAAKGFGRKTGKEAYWSNKIKVVPYTPSSDYRRRY